MPAWVAPAIIAAVQLIGRAVDQRRQKLENRAIAKYQASANEQYQQSQNTYNSPQAQMMRYQRAGLNPHLIYSQGTPGNQAATLTYPGIQPVNYGGTFENVATDFQSSQMLQTQMDATEAKTAKTISDTDINRVKKEILKANPYLNEDYLNSVVANMVTSAGIKAQEFKQAGIDTKILEMSAGHIVNKLFREVNLLEEKYNLAEADKKIKAQILRSATFQADLAEVQKKWMTDAEITPQHIYQFIMAFLLKLAK